MLPKDLLKHAKKLDPEKIEAEILRIVSAKANRKPLVPDSLQDWLLQPAAIGPINKAWEAAQLHQYSQEQLLRERLREERDRERMLLPQLRGTL